MNIKTSILTIALFAALASCTSPLSTRMEDFVSDAEVNYMEWTAEDWELSKEEYNELVREYNKNYDQYTQEEREAINRAIGRYNGLVVKRRFEEASETLREFSEQIPSYIEGFMSAFEENQ